MAISTITGVSTGSTGTVLTTGSSGQSIPKAALPTGSVLQVVSTNTNTTASYALNAYITPLQTTITPTSATSKILVQVFLGYIGANTAADLGISVYRDSTNIGLGTGASYANVSFIPAMNVDSTHGNAATWSFLDSPASTSLLTYKVQAVPNSTNLMYFNRRGADNTYNCSSTVVLMEIAA